MTEARTGTELVEAGRGGGGSGIRSEWECVLWLSNGEMDCRQEDFQQEDQLRGCCITVHPS